jgi:type I restriction enzyme S subunit
MTMANQTTTIPKGWKTTTLGNIPESWNLEIAESYCEKVADGTHATPKPVERGKHLITSKHIKDGRVDLSSAYKISENDFIEINKRSKVNQWDVLFSMIGTVGEIALIDRVPDYAIKNVGLFKCGEESRAKWLYYFLRGKIGQDEIQRRMNGTTQSYVTLGDLRSFPLIIPSSNTELKAIVAVLSSLDDKIELLRDQNKTLEATAQAIFKEWFVNFNFPGATGKTIDSELGKIPEGWRVGKLGEEFKIEYGKSDKNFDADGLHPVYGAGGIVGYSNFADYRDYQVIIGCRGTCGNITLAYEDSKITHNSLIISSDWFKPFIYLYLHSVDIGKAITGSTQPQITIGDLDNIEILIPQNKIVSTFVEIIAPIFKKKGNNNSQIQTLATFRDALLPKLMKGELRVNGFID